MRIFARASLLALCLVPATLSAQTTSSPVGALRFDGASTYVQVASNASLTLSNRVTFEAWVYPNAQPAGAGAIISRGDGGNGALTDYIVELQNSGSALKLAFFGVNAWDYSTGTLPTNAWSHVAVTFDGTNKQFFINGVLDSTVARAGTMYSSGLPVNIGQQGSVCGCNLYKGIMGEVRIWNTVRTTNQIAQDYGHVLTGSEAGLAAYYKFSCITGVTTRDSSTNGNTGLLVNRPVPVPLTVPIEFSMMLNGPNPLTNECHTPFVDPGAAVQAPPFNISAGSYSGYAIKADGTVDGWGYSYNGFLQLPSSATNVIALAARQTLALALRADGNLVAWGSNASGQTNVPPNATNVVAAAAGLNFGLALTADGHVVVWGSNNYGQTNVPPNATNAVAIAAGEYHGVALRADGSVIAWGYAASGLTNVPPTATNVVAISAGNSFSLALRADGSVIGWGDDSDGETDIPAAATNVVAIAAGASSSYALRADGSLVAWGYNANGQTSIPPSATNVTAIVAGISHAIALRADGTLIAWGDDTYGETNIPANVDALDLPVTTNGTVNPNVTGTYQLTYTATNNGFSFTNSRTVVVTDTQPPTLTLLGANPLQIVAGNPYVDPGATATDACAGDLSASVIVTGSVNTTVPGSYTLTYNVSDPSGNAAVPTNRTVIVVGAPLLSGFAASLVATNAATAVVTAQLSANVNPNGLDSTVYFQYGLNSSYTAATAPVSVPGDFVVSNVTAIVPYLSRGVVYHWQAVASNSVGVAYGPDQVLPVPGLYIAGDLNGDGIVSASELNTVLSNYYATSPWLYITNTAGLGQSNVTFALSNSFEGAFSVEVSTNLIDWEYLGPAIPRYGFTDTNAPAATNRYYRLRWP